MTLKATTVVLPCVSDCTARTPKFLRIYNFFDSILKFFGAYTYPTKA